MTKPYILCIDTAQESCHLALLNTQTDAITLNDAGVSRERKQAEIIFGQINTLLKTHGVSKSEIGAVAFGMGPGSFTGLRVACGVAQGIAWGLEVPVIPVNNLEVTAYDTLLEDGAQVGNRIAVMLDARMNELYTGLYEVAEDGTLMEREAAQLVKPEDAKAWLVAHQADVLVGNGAKVYAEAFADLPLVNAGEPKNFAKALAKVSFLNWQAKKTIAPQLASPLYVRDRVALTAEQRRRGEKL